MTADGTPTEPARQGLRSRAGQWYGEAVVPRWRILRQFPTVGPALLAPMVLVSLALGVLPVVFVLVSSMLVGRIPAAVAQGVGSPAWDELVTVFAAVAAVFAAQQLLAPVQAALSEIARRRVDGVVLDRLIELSLRSTGIGPLEDQDTLNALAEARRPLDNGWRTPGDACNGQLAMLSRYLRLLGFVTLVAAIVSWWAGAVLLAVVLMFRHGQQGGHRRYSRVWRRITPDIRRGDYLRNVAIDGADAKELRVFGLTRWVSDRYAEAYHVWLRVIWRERRRLYLYPFLVYTAVGLVVTVMVYVVVARSAASGQVALTQLAVALQATLAALLLGEHWPEADIQTAFGIRASLATDRFEELVERAAGPNAPAGPQPPGSPIPGGSAPGSPALSVAGPCVDPRDLPRRELSFRGVEFRYPGGAVPVLDGLDLTLPAGLCTAVVGVNGAGKTTLVKLLSRLYEPTGGVIAVDGVPLPEVPVEAWRRQVSVIFQDFVRYELSAADNIAFGAPHVPRDERVLRRAAERAGVLEVLDGLSEGLDTPLSRAYPGGVDLSGGQWQRVAIARALYALEAGARVLVLDEPTAALDVRAEAAFFDRFVDLTRGVTSLLISHRFSSVRRADRVVVIDGGRAVEQGTHEELLAADGHYARLFRLQAERFAAGLDAEGREVGHDQDETSGGWPATSQGGRR